MEISGRKIFAYHTTVLQAANWKKIFYQKKDLLDGNLTFLMIYYLCVSYLYATTLFVSILTVIQKVSNSHHTILSLYDFIISNLATL